MEARSGSSQTVTADRQYDAFGQVVSSSGTWNGAFGYAGAFGYQEDGDYGLKLLGHRYYDPSTGRFLTRDPIKDGRNWYGYCENNPIIFLDSMGLRPTWVYKAVCKGKGLFQKYGQSRDLPVRQRQISRKLGFPVKLIPIKRFDDDIPVGTKYSKQNREALDFERELVLNNPGPHNHEPWAGKGSGIISMGILSINIRQLLDAVDPTFVGKAKFLAQVIASIAEPLRQNAQSNAENGTGFYESDSDGGSYMWNILQYRE